LLCTAAAVIYGIVHDQITVRIYPPYFTVFHPRLIDSQDPTTIGLLWGFIATWWVGLALGIAVAISSQSGEGVRFPTRKLIKPVLVLLGSIGLCAAGAGSFSYVDGYALSEWRMNGVEVTGNYPLLRNFTAVLVTHNASYAFGFLGGIVLCAWILAQRKKLSRGSMP
jgi:hypothetical protein